jgi:glycerol-3-phosphate dehydrogenase
VKVRDLKISCDVVVVGGGAVGAFATLDLTLRGVKTALLERRYVCSGTSGRSHGMLHSGARYAASDERAARECISENTILSRIAPHCVRDVGGIFVSVSESDEDYHSILLNGCHRAGIPAREMDRDNLAALEPNISPEARTAILVPDKIVYARDLVTTVLLASIGRGATVLEEAEVAKIRVERGEVVGVEAYSPSGSYGSGTGEPYETYPEQNEASERRRHYSAIRKRRLNRRHHSQTRRGPRGHRGNG